VIRSARIATPWRQASLPAGEPGFQPAGRSHALATTPRIFSEMINTPTVFSGRQDADLYGRQEARRYNA